MSPLIFIGLISLPGKISGSSKLQDDFDNISIAIKWAQLDFLILPYGSITGYKIYIYDEYGNKKFIYETNSPIIKSYIYKGLITGNDYKFYASAINFNGKGEFSDPFINKVCDTPKFLVNPTFISSTITSINLKISPRRWRLWHNWIYSLKK
jgi:hypothetical protein